MIELAHDERIITAFAEGCDGPGWSNSLVTVIISNRDGSLRSVSLQPHEQTAAMSILFDVSNSTHVAMTKAVEDLTSKS